MAVFKIEKCPKCRYQRNEPRLKNNRPCPRCGKKMNYSDNWYISYQVLGRKKVEAVGPQKRLAEDALGKIRVDIREGRYFNMMPETPWHVAVEKFRAWAKINVKPNTQRMYENSLKVLAPYFEAYTLDKITAPMVEMFKSSRMSQAKTIQKGNKRIATDKTITPATVNRDLATLKRLFSLSEEWGLVEVDRIRKVKLLSEKEQRRDEFLKENEMDRLLSECQHIPHLHMAILVALNTGLRKDSVLTLKWSEIDFQHRRITKVVKGGKKLPIPLERELAQALHAYRSAQKIMSKYVIPSTTRQGQPLSTLSKDFRAALRRAGITKRVPDFRFHDLRHTFASHFIMRTGDLKALQEILGHEDIKTTMRYAHLLDEHKHRAMEQFTQKKNRKNMSLGFSPTIQLNIN
jgi:integrase